MTTLAPVASPRDPAQRRSWRDFGRRSDLARDLAALVCVVGSLTLVWEIHGPPVAAIMPWELIGQVGTETVEVLAADDALILLTAALLAAVLVVQMIVRDSRLAARAVWRMVAAVAFLITPLASVITVLSADGIPGSGAMVALVGGVLALAPRHRDLRRVAEPMSVLRLWRMGTAVLFLVLVISMGVFTVTLFGAYLVLFIPFLIYMATGAALVLGPLIPALWGRGSWQPAALVVGLGPFVQILAADVQRQLENGTGGDAPLTPICIAPWTLAIAVLAATQITPILQDKREPVGFGSFWKRSASVLFIAAGANLTVGPATASSLAAATGAETSAPWPVGVIVFLAAGGIATWSAPTLRNLRWGTRLYLGAGGVALLLTGLGMLGLVGGQAGVTAPLAVAGAGGAVAISLAAARPWYPPVPPWFPPATPWNPPVSPVDPWPAAPIAPSPDDGPPTVPIPVIREPSPWQPPLSDSGR